MKRFLVMLSLAAVAGLGLAALRKQALQRRMVPNALAWDGEAGSAQTLGNVDTLDNPMPADDAAVYAEAAERESSA